MNANVSWAGEPRRCTCTTMVVATLEETLGCPFMWSQLPSGDWAHVLPVRVRPRRVTQ